MNISVYQCISVHNLNIGTVTNSSVLQIGTSGKINALSHNYQTQGEKIPPSSSVNIGESRLVPLPEPAKLYPR
ncbi:spore germination protein GerPB [Paenibacillus sp. DS2015]|uniref:spore germination protein GerPB n=1 Tax=Paenibacillus sp. DS2015 TaxID=3373917 RepID=UPI003D24CEFC